MRQRASRHLDVFVDDEDCEWYLELLRRASAVHGLDVHAFALMATHAHLLATARTPWAVSKTMHSVGQRYSAFFNHKYGRSGTLWHGRYEAQAVDNDAYALLCIRYIEQNPVRAGIVSCADEYRWTSYAIHALGRESEWVVPHPVCVQLGDSSDSRQRAYRALCSEPIARRDMLWLREARPSRQQQEVAHSAPGMRIA